MFSKEKNGQAERFAPINATLISAGTVLNGDVTSDNDLRIDGQINGNVACSAKIIIGATGVIEGTIEGENAGISGRVQGNIIIKELLQLRGEGVINGNITAGKLGIDPSATFNGNCQMGTTVNIVQMTQHEPTEAKAN